MTKSEYAIIDDFQVKNMRVLVLDSNYEFDGRFAKAIVEGEMYSYTLNSVKNWILIKSTDNFKGKKIKFIRDTQKETSEKNSDAMKFAG